MNPKEKAIELINAMKSVGSEDYVDENNLWEKKYKLSNNEAKQLALVAINSQIGLFVELSELGLLKTNSVGFELLDIKKEIENYF